MKLRKIKSHGRGSSDPEPPRQQLDPHHHHQQQKNEWAELFGEVSSNSFCTTLKDEVMLTNENIEMKNSNLKNISHTTTNTTTIKQKRRRLHFHYSPAIFFLTIVVIMVRMVDCAPTGLVKRAVVGEGGGGGTAAIIRKVPPTLAILDGLVSYSEGGANMSMSNFRDLSRSAFLSLQGTPIEAKLPAYRIDGEGGDGVTSDEEQDLLHVEHMTRHHRKKNRRPGGGGGGGAKKDAPKPEIILEGRKHALMQLADPKGLKMTQKCDGQKFKQRVRADGCLTKVVVNRLCHGTCASFFIPRMHSKKLKAAFKSCATCAPSDYDFVDITLDCPGQDPPTATRTIVKVKSCKCREVSISSLYA